jgi:hypothetical protein
MSNHQTPAVITGRMIGVHRLNVLISACELEGKGLRRRGESALKILKRELRCKGSRDGVLAYAREVLANVQNW